eukprot:3385306-Amphidinium_carterae.3
MEHKGGKAGQQVPVQQVNDNDYYYGEDPISWDNSWDNSWNQKWCPEGDVNQQWSGQDVGQVLQQPPGESTTSPQTMGSLYEIGSLTTAFIHIDRHSPRHLKDFWSIIIDTGAAVGVRPKTFCEHIAVKTMPESACQQFVTVTGEGLAISERKEVTLVI